MSPQLPLGLVGAPLFPGGLLLLVSLSMHRTGYFGATPQTVHQTIDTACLVCDPVLFGDPVPDLGRCSKPPCGNLLGDLLLGFPAKERFLPFSAHLVQEDFRHASLSIPSYPRLYSSVVDTNCCRYRGESPSGPQQSQTVQPHSQLNVTLPSIRCLQRLSRILFTPNHFKRSPTHCLPHPETQSGVRVDEILNIV